MHAKLNILEHWNLEWKMTSKYLILIVMFCPCSYLFADGNSSTEPASYNVVRTNSAPTIDGVVSPGEWSNANAAADRFVNLRAHTPDTHNVRFQAMWDDDNLYLLGLSDYDGFAGGGGRAGIETAPNDPEFNGTGYQYNFYIDPNNDGAQLGPDPVLGTTVDGYQIAWDVFEGFSSRRPTEGNPSQALRDPLEQNGTSVNDYIGGLFLEAHVDSPFGNQGQWDRSNEGPNQNYRDDVLPGLVYAAIADNTDVNGTGQPGHVWEWSISWDSLNATDPNADVDPPFAENGLFAVDGPSVGDEWGFEMAIITNDFENFLPSWSEPAGGDETRSSFAPWGTVGHGRLVFAPVPEPDALFSLLVGLGVLLGLRKRFVA